MTPSNEPSPGLIFQTLTSYQNSAALKAGIDLDLFTFLAQAPATASQIAKGCHASERGIRILCDYLTVQGFLTKAGDQYALTPDSAVFLNKKSKAYAGGCAEFLLSDHLTHAFAHLTEAVRSGTTAEPKQGSMTPEHPMWQTFARAMAGIISRSAEHLAGLIPLQGAAKVLDVAAGHGLWGISFGKRYPGARITALDWKSVLPAARENAVAAGIEDRFSAIPGSAFEADWGREYDLVLLPNFLHHFNKADCVRLLKLAHAALRPGGKVALVEFVPNEDRVTPPHIAGFSLVMLATTPAGDAYTFNEFAEMLGQAGFQKPERHELPPPMNLAIIAAK